MNRVDLWIGIVLLFYAILGYRVGILYTFATLLLVYFATYLASFFAPIALGAFSFLLVEETAAGSSFLFLFVFIFIYLLGEFVFTVLKNMVQVSILGPLDKVGGLALGIFKGMLICAVAFEIIMTFSLSKGMLAEINNSYLKKWSTDLLKATYPLTITYAPKIHSFLAGRVMPAVAGTAATVAVSSAEATEAVSAAKGKTTKAVNKVQRFTP